MESTINHTRDLDRFLGIAGNQRPVACQLGGNDPEKLARAAKAVESYGYDEINLNVGCPSSRVAVRGGGDSAVSERLRCGCATLQVPHRFACVGHRRVTAACDCVVGDGWAW